MVLEKLYPLNLIERNPFYAFILGLSYSIIGIGASLLLFPEDPAIVSVAFISLMFYPTINALMRQEEEIESEKTYFGFALFFKDHKNVFKVYVFLFLGILLPYSIFSMVLPSLATNHIFENQLNAMYGQTATGAATFNLPLLNHLILNNLSVLILCFITAFLIGDGAIFLIVWNASVWGTIFGTIAKNAAIKGSGISWAVCQTPINCFLVIMLIVFIHMIIEAFAYMLAATAGGTISKALIKEGILSLKFRQLFFNIFIITIFSLIILGIGATIETLVLTHSDTYRLIVRQSFL